MSRFRLSLIFTVLKMKLNWFWVKERYLNQLTVCLHQSLHSKPPHIISLIQLTIHEINLLLHNVKSISFFHILIHFFKWNFSSVTFFYCGGEQWLTLLFSLWLNDFILCQSLFNQHKIPIKYRFLWFRFESFFWIAGTRKNFLRL